jgi:uncharacterized protein (UPF0332 family)
LSSERVETAIRLAEEYLAAARDDLDNDRIHRAASSLYFAVFDACVGALIARGVETRKLRRTTSRRPSLIATKSPRSRTAPAA